MNKDKLNKLKENALNFLSVMKEGLNDAKNMLLEQNYKPFALPVIILVIFAFIVNYTNGKARAKVMDVKNKIEAQKAEMSHMQEYTTAKEIYEDIVKKLPPSDNKNEWLYTTMNTIFDQLNISPGRTGKLVMEEEGPFTLASVTYETEIDFNQLGALVEAIESPSRPFLRISELTAMRNEGSLGMLNVGLRVNTVFVTDGK